MKFYRNIILPRSERLRCIIYEVFSLLLFFRNIYERLTNAHQGENRKDVENDKKKETRSKIKIVFAVDMGRCGGWG